MDRLATPATQDQDHAIGLIVSAEAKDALTAAFGHALATGQEALVSFLNCLDRMKDNRFFNRASRCTLYLDHYSNRNGEIPAAFYWAREVRAWNADAQAWEWKVAMNGGMIWSQYSQDWGLHT